MKTRFVISLIVVNAVVLVACGTGSESRGPRQIPAGSGANATRDAKLAGGSASDMPMLAPDVTYEPAANLVVDFDASNPDATYPSWEFAAPENPAASAAARSGETNWAAAAATGAPAASIDAAPHGDGSLRPPGLCGPPTQCLHGNHSPARLV